MSCENNGAIREIIRDLVEPLLKIKNISLYSDGKYGNTYKLENIGYLYIFESTDKTEISVLLFVKNIDIHKKIKSNEANFGFTRNILIPELCLWNMHILHAQGGQMVVETISKIIGLLET